MSEISRFAALADRMIFVTILASGLIGCLPIFSLLFGYPFLPSEAYASKLQPFASLFAIFLGMALSYFFFWSPLSGDRWKSAGQAAPARWHKVVSVVLISAMGHAAVTGGIPMIMAIGVGTEVGLLYTVQDAAGYGDRRCRQPVELKSLPFLFKNVCRVPEELRARLKPGMRIELAGWGTVSGLFYERITVMEAGHV